ncbi:MAG TPA: M48 family metallopeptidase [Rhizomicrobium sp.]|nr:M48 family metallopeptidase [Rhizomicrobium sp.]
MVEGNYFFPLSTRFVAARARPVNRLLRIEDMQGETLAEFRARAVIVSARMGRLPRSIALPDGGRFETPDNDGVDALKRALGLGNPGRFLDMIERSRNWIALSLAMAAVLSYAFIEYGIPAIALALARATPPSVGTAISRQTLDLMDRAMLRPSTLKPQDRARAQALLARVAQQSPRGPKGYHLELRHGGAGIGANAFALPDGTIVMTDELWALARNDEEIEGVLGHEMSHVERRHGLQELYQASMIPAALAVVTGDISQVSQLAAVLPGVLVETHHARDFEQQADDDAAAKLIAMGAKPSRLADLLERLETSHCGKTGCGSASWLGSHPDTDARVARLRAETK